MTYFQGSWCWLRVTLHISMLFPSFSVSVVLQVLFFPCSNKPFIIRPIILKGSVQELFSFRMFATGDVLNPLFIASYLIGVCQANDTSWNTLIMVHSLWPQLGTILFDHDGSFLITLFCRLEKLVLPWKEYFQRALSMLNSPEWINVRVWVGWRTSSSLTFSGLI